MGEHLDSQAAGLVLHHQRHMVEGMLEDGVISDLDADNLLASLNKRLKLLYIEAVSSTLERSHYMSRCTQVRPHLSDERSEGKEGFGSASDPSPLVVYRDRSRPGQPLEMMDADQVANIFVVASERDLASGGLSPR